MPKNKLHNALSQLEKRDIDRFGLFIRSPFYNQKQTLVTYMENLVGNYPNYELSEKKTFDALWPGEEYDSQRLRDIRSRLFKLLKHFLASVQMEANPHLMDRLLLEGYAKRGMLGLAATELKAKTEAQSRNSFVSFPNAENDLMLNERRVDFALLENGEGVVNLDYGSLLFSLDRYYLARRLEILAAMGSYEEVIEREIPGQARLETALLAERSGVVEEPLVKTYYQLLEIQKNSTSLIELKRYFALLASSSIAIAPEKRYNIFATLINRFLADLRLGIPDSLRKAFLTYQQLHQHNLYAYLKTAALKLIRSTVAAGARLGEFAWTRQYLDEAIDQVPKELRSMTYQFGMAQLAFHQRAFSEAKKHLLHVEFSDPQIRLSAQNILLKCYFETQETEAFTSLIDSTRRYLQRHKEFSHNYRQGYQNFLNLIRPTYDLRWGLGKKPSGSQLLARLDEYEYFFNRDWIREQLEALAGVH